MKRFLLASLVCFSLLSAPFAPFANATAISITAANFAPSSQAKYLDGKNLAGETLTAGQAVYIDTAASAAAGQIKKASAIGTGLSTQVVGFAANSASLGQPVKVLTRDPALTLGGAVTAGCVIYLGTAGAVTLTYADLSSGGYVAVLAVGISTTKINFGGTYYAGKPLGVIRADVAIP